MEEGFIINKDIDDLILCHLDPPDVLIMSRVNKHYRKVLEAKRDMVIYGLTSMRSTGNKFAAVCGTGSMWLVSWFAQTLKHFYSMPAYRMIHEEKTDCLSHQFNGQGFAYSFMRASWGGHRHIAEWLIAFAEEENIYLDIQPICNKLFTEACMSGDLDLAKWVVGLVSHGKTPSQKAYLKTNIHYDSEAPFRLACAQGHVDLAKWLIAIGEETHSPIPKKLINGYANILS